jgi:CheY-like chemotaxis protein
MPLKCTNGSAASAAYRTYDGGLVRWHRAFGVIVKSAGIIWAARYLSQMNTYPSRSPFPASALMMALDRACIPAVVLIVEDEMVLRMRVVDMVEDAGYTPLEALDAAEAVAILESRSDVALICTDIQMPGQMDGVGLAHAVHARWPAIRIIVVSGQLNLPHLDLPPRSRFLGKPLNAGEVIAEMRDMIGYT